MVPLYFCMEVLMLPFTKKFNELYTNICVRMTMEEQMRIFGMVGFEEIIKKYGKKDALKMSENFLEKKYLD